MEGEVDIKLSVLVKMNNLKLMLRYLQLDPLKGIEIKLIQKISLTQRSMDQF